MSDGKFFEKRAKVDKGRFFRDLPGRDDGQFNKAAQRAYGPGVGAAMSGTMGGAFNVGAINPGGQVFGTGKGCAAKAPKPKKAVLKKKAEFEDPLEYHAPGEHRPATEQPRDLAPGGARFLQESPDNSTASVSTSGLHRSKMKKQSSDLRFMGTSFEKRARRRDDLEDGSLAGDVKRDIRRLPGGAGETGRGIVESGHTGARKVYRAGSGAVKGLAERIADSPALSLLALGLGGYGAARLAKGMGSKLFRLSRKPKPKPSMAASLLAKIKGK